MINSHLIEQHRVFCMDASTCICYVPVAGHRG